MGTSTPTHWLFFWLAVATLAAGCTKSLTNGTTTAPPPARSAASSAAVTASDNEAAQSAPSQIDAADSEESQANEAVALAFANAPDISSSGPSSSGVSQASAQSSADDDEEEENEEDSSGSSGSSSGGRGSVGYARGISSGTSSASAGSGSSTQQGSDGSSETTPLSLSAPTAALEAYFGMNPMAVRTAGFSGIYGRSALTLIAECQLGERLDLNVGGQVFSLNTLKCDFIAEKRFTPVGDEGEVISRNEPVSWETYTKIGSERYKELSLVKLCAPIAERNSPDGDDPPAEGGDDGMSLQPATPKANFDCYELPVQPHGDSPGVAVTAYVPTELGEDFSKVTFGDIGFEIYNIKSDDLAANE